jgi:hypothetical protein
MGTRIVKKIIEKKDSSQRTGICEMGRVRPCWWRLHQRGQRRPLPGHGSVPGGLLPCGLQASGLLRQGPYRVHGRVPSSCQQSECGPGLSRHPVLALLYHCRHGRPGRRGPCFGDPGGHCSGFRSWSRGDSQIRSSFVSAAPQAAQACWNWAPPSP